MRLKPGFARAVAVCVAAAAVLSSIVIVGMNPDIQYDLARLREANLKILEMELQSPDLEDVFLRLTGRSLVD